MRRAAVLRLLLLASGALNLGLLQHLGAIHQPLAVMAGLGLLGALVWDELRQRELDEER